ncbi:helicase associated domain-containing protein [Pseudofrankia sp. BMG5.36]|uniref:helicase associated domain-containing protein n=1 Tax=Pseudofrankia sp. BMG5.36 TaxID=1834512 RepID=UPI0008D9E043|nr:helicase associated domain-containing protein [Pseudofrankia sp. BMG5.36]OHV62963.1 hypothetical protein BCD48_38690 [Pseudofrankia sp. BMG5.36]
MSAPPDPAAEAEAAEFERGLHAIRVHAAGHGTTEVPHGYVDESGFPLAVWVAVQREAHLEQRLGDARRAALVRLPGWRWLWRLSARLDRCDLLRPHSELENDSSQAR